MEALLHSTLMIYAPIAIVIGGFIDTFFISGYLIYGFALSSAVLMIYTAGEITYTQILISSYIGTLLGSYTNFLCGWFLANTRPVRKVVDSPKMLRVRANLVSHNLFVAMFICRFITVLRPACLLVLGTLRLPAKKVLLYEAIIALVWVLVWSTILVVGAETIIKTIKMAL